MYQRNLGGFSANYSTVVAVIAVVVLIIAGVGVFSMGKAVITVTPRVSIASVDFVEQIVTDGNGKDALSGILAEVEAEGTAIGESTGSEIVKDTNVIGSVTLINNYSKEQTLVATTRLLSPDGVLLRLKDKVTVPVGGKVQVKVYADNPASFKELPPTMFTIPGLWQGLQDKIYAESKDVIKNTPGEIKIVKAADIVKAKESAAKDADNKAIKQFSENLPNGQDFIIAVADREIQKESITAKIGENVSGFEANVKQKITLIAVERNNVIAAAGDKIKASGDGDRDVIGINEDALTLSIDKYDLKNRTADAKIHVEARTVIRSTSPILDKTKLFGLTAKGAQLYLLNFDEVENVDVLLSPFWVKKLPSVENKIFIQIKKN